MSENTAETIITEHQAFSEALHTHAFGKALQMLNEMNSAEVAHLLESLPADDRDLAWDLVRTKLEGDVLVHVNDNLRAQLIGKMEPHELVAATSGLETDDLADLLPDMPDEVFNQVLRSMDEQNRQRLESALSYPEDSAGGMMNMDTVTVRADITVDVALRYLRRHRELPGHTDTLMVVDREGKFSGVVPLTTLLTSSPEATLDKIMRRDVEAIPADMPAHEVAKLFELHDLVSAPVVDGAGMLLGRITIDDVVDIIRDEGEHSLMSMAGLHEEEDLFAPVVPSARRRALWLGLNLLTAFLASWVIGLFDATIEKLVALAVLMPIVASMGGIAGSQTMTLVIRGLALDPDQRSQRPQTAVQGGGGGPAQRSDVGGNGGRGGLALVPGSLSRRGDSRRHDHQPGGSRLRRGHAAAAAAQTGRRPRPGGGRGAHHRHRRDRFPLLSGSGDDISHLNTEDGFFRLPSSVLCLSPSVTPAPHGESCAPPESAG